MLMIFIGSPAIGIESKKLDVQQWPSTREEACMDEQEVHI